MDSSSILSLAAEGGQTRALRIALVAPSLDILGGQGVQADSLARALRDSGFDVLFLPINPRFPAGLRWLRRVPLLRTLLNQLLYLPSLRRLRDADLVHVFSASYWSFLLAPAPAIFAARLYGKPVWLNYHSGEAPDHLANWGWRVHPFLRRVDGIVLPSVWLQGVFAEHGYPARVIRNMVDTSAFRFRERRPLAPRLLSNRNLEPIYRVDNTLRAFALLKQRYPQATLTVAGYGSQDAALRHLAAELGMQGIRFVGRVPPGEMPALFDAADLFVNSSEVDNQPLSILEAFAAGLNVVSTPTGDIPAMVRDGDTGRLVPHDDPPALAAALTELLEAPDTAARLAANARAEVEKYTWTAVARDWTRLYKGEGA